MTGARGWRAAAVAATVLWLSGCAVLPFGRDADSAPASAAGAPRGAASAPKGGEREQYRLEIVAPDPLQALLTEYLDLSRFRVVPAADAVEPAELERLLRAAPAQARQLLETEGYFAAQVEAGRVGQDGDLPLLRVTVEPGPLTTVAAVSLEAGGDLGTRAAAGDAAAARELAALRGSWALAPGQIFRQAAWSNAKVTTLARLRADGYAAATWNTTNARVDAEAHRADLAVVVDSGPLYRFGEVRITGLERYDESAVRRLATFSPGEPYSERTLLDFQERLQKLGLFEVASVELDPNAASSQAAPVLVRVREQQAQQATFGVGVSANTGARFSVEHIDRSVFGTKWISKNKFELGPVNRTWTGELTSYPLADQYRNLVSGSYSNLLVEDQTLNSWNVRAGRSQETTRIGRLYYAEIAHARLDSDELTNNADAISVNANWVFRDVDNLLLPTRGLVTTAQVGVGTARGTRSVGGLPVESASGPFSRLYARFNWYRPLGGEWYLSTRVEAGQVLTRSAVGIPDTLLFRAGGDDSVRGYSYRSLGPTIAGVTVSGRSLATGSVEFAHPLLARLPALWGAVFVDAGNAADRWSSLRPALGYGVGMRYRSPVGPLRVDVAYGQDDRRFRLHFSVGVAF